MRFFRREDPSAAPDFWTWWAGARDRIANGIESGGFDSKLIEEVARAVRAVDPRLAWEFQPGRRARHALCVTPEGNAEVRPVALTWVAGAPPADATWEYHASRQASPTLRVLEIAGRRLDLGETRAISSWDARRRRLDVRLWHRGFAGAPTGVANQVAFLFLDNLLGEDDVERWIGQVVILDAPSDGKTPDELKAEVARHAAEPAEETWIVGQGTGPDGRPMIVMADAALKRIDHPFADKHIEIRLPIEGGGMPDAALAGQLNAEEDRLVGLLDGAATLAGRTTEPGQRVIHLVADELDPVFAVIDAWAKDLPPWRIKVQPKLDPGWEFQRELGVR